MDLPVLLIATIFAPNLTGGAEALAFSKDVANLEQCYHTAWDLYELDPTLSYNARRKSRTAFLTTTPPRVRAVCVLKDAGAPIDPLFPPGVVPACSAFSDFHWDTFIEYEEKWNETEMSVGTFNALKSSLERVNAAECFKKSISNFHLRSTFLETLPQPPTADD